MSETFKLVKNYTKQREVVNRYEKNGYVKRGSQDGDTSTAVYLMHGSGHFVGVSCEGIAFLPKQRTH